MARVPYSPTVDTEPQLEAPQDFQHIEVPNAGARLEQGLGEAGQGALDLSKFYGQAAADNATNNFIEQSNGLLYGDAAKGPAVDPSTGQPMKDPTGATVYQGGFFGLRGRAALDAAGETREQLQDMLAEQRAGLKTPAARLEFDNQSRRYVNETLAKMGVHAATEQKVWMKDTNVTTATLALNEATRNAASDDAANIALAKVKTAYEKNAQIEGVDPRGADLQAQQAVALARINALVGSPDIADREAAQRVLQDNAGALGSLKDYDHIVAKVKQANFDAISVTETDKFVAGELASAQSEARGTAVSVAAGVAPTPKGGVYDQIGAAATQHGATPDEQAYLKRTAQIESSGNPNAPRGGLYQLRGNLAEAAGGNDVGRQTTVTLDHARANAQQLTAAGVAPSGANLYLMHQQGPAGGLALLKAAPGESAVAALTPAYEHGGRDPTQAHYLATQAVVNNGGSADMTAQQFTAMWQQRWDRGAGKVGLHGGALAVSASGGTTTPGQYPSTADALRANMASNLDAARQLAEQKFPNYPEYQQRFVDGVERRLNQTIEQQNQQYQVDTHIVEAAIAQGRVHSEADLNTDPELARAWDSVQVNNPYAGMAIEKRLDANSQGKAVSLGIGFKGYLDRVLAPKGDPDEITNPVSLNTFVGAGKEAALTNTGVEQLTTLLGLRGNAQGEAQASQIKSFVDSMHAQMTFSNAAMGVYDTKGEERFAAYMTTALPIIVNAAKGGNLTTVLDPNSPDFAGKLALPFQRSAAEMMKDQADDLPQGPATAYTMDSLNRTLNELDNDDQRKAALKDAVARGRVDLSIATYIGQQRGYFQAPTNADPFRPPPPQPIIVGGRAIY